MALQGWSAEPGAKGSWFGRINGGLGDVTSKTYCGMDLGMEVGYYPLKGLSVGLGIGWYTSDVSKFGKVYLDGSFLIPDTWDYYLEPEVNGYSKESTKLQNSLRLRGFVGYDVFSLTGRCERFHFIPILGFGISQQRLFFYKYSEEKTMIEPMNGTPFPLYGVVENEHSVQSKFEMDLGARFDYDLPEGWAVGAYYTWYFLNQKMSCAGVSLTKNF